MNATIEVNLSDSLNAEELCELTAEAEEQDKPIARVLYEAAKEVARRRREQREGKEPALAA
ncbi:hypothetical protein [Prosthecobacter dejongeii]|uniref:Uncharacterized protein n=1 Tax=Prosthecobacter dejongeii TaxID=48465 RepID=A0A7W8DQE7_9BACT|nr:hypothetical protein [Prosthecobacter dejongeii]MBB5038237.1 hypothetical protein [Prosthecobacter dejongeii]